MLGYFVLFSWYFICLALFPCGLYLHFYQLDIEDVSSFLS